MIMGIGLGVAGLCLAMAGAIERGTVPFLVLLVLLGIASAIFDKD